jgi:hypothetical protein
MVMSGAQVTLDVGARNGYVVIGLTIAGVAADTRTCLLAPRLRDRRTRTWLRTPRHWAERRLPDITRPPHEAATHPRLDSERLIHDGFASGAYALRQRALSEASPASYVS